MSSLNLEAATPSGPNSKDPVILEMPPPNRNFIRQVIEKRLAFAGEVARSQGIEQLPISVDESGLDALIEVSGTNLRSILGMIPNCGRFATEVEGRKGALVIDSDLVRKTHADIQKTLNAGDGEETGDLRAFSF